MSDPLVPNFKSGVGRLTTDRFDFQNHVDGKNFKHKANQIDLFTTLVIDGSPRTNVQDALAALSGVVTAPSVPDATISSKGLIQLTGDIAGAATNVIVTRIQQRPISTLAPSTNDVLTWNGTTWLPQTNANTFNANGDLSGDNISQQVIRITGGGFLNAVFVDCNNVVFKDSSSPAILQLPDTNDGENLLITAQGSIGTNKKGGAVVISGGARTGSGSKGGVTLQINEAEVNMVQLAEPVNGQRVLALLNPVNVSNIDMPADSGDMVIYVGDTATPPDTGTPTNGTILYSYDGKLYVKQTDSDNFPIGSLSNPSIWGPAGQQTYYYRSFGTSTVVQVPVLTFAMSDNTATYVECTFVGKKVGNNDVAQYIVHAGFTRSGTGPLVVGSFAQTDLRTRGTASGWFNGNVLVSGNNLQIVTGVSNTSETIKWFITTKITVVGA